MKKRIVLPLLIVHSIVFQVNAMNNPVIEQSNALCYLAKMPLDICNHIVSFLMWETEEEFVARSKTEKKLRIADYSQYFEKGLFGCCETELFCVLSPAQSKCAVLKLFNDDCPQQNLTIVDLCTRQKIYNGGIKNRIYECLALSQGGSMIATIHKDMRDPRVVIGSMYPYRVTIKKINTGQTQIFFIIRLSEPFTINFNKQGTDVIVRGTHYSDQPACKEHIIFSLKNNVVEPINAVDKTNKLQDYFTHHRVCNMLSSSL